MNRLLLVMWLALPALAHAQTDSSKTLKNVTVEQFTKLTTREDKLVLVAFRANWCVVCKRQEPLLLQLARERSSELELLILDMEENPLIAEYFEVDALPVNLLFRSGHLVWNRVGYRSYDELTETVNEFRFKRSPGY